MGDSEIVMLSVENLKVQFRTERGLLTAVNNISFEVKGGETVGIVGESGCGKTVTSLSILRIVPEPPGEIVGGSIRFQGQDLLKLSRSKMRAIRGKQISMIFQEPMTALNPVFTIGNQMIDVLRRHQGVSSVDAKKQAIEMLEIVRIPSASRRINEYPHQLSGGMRQRVMIAMALSCRPKLLVADEPTTALDVTTQAQVLEQMKELQNEYSMAMILVTHDLGVIAETCQRVIVMYCGRIIESATVEEIFKKPLHPYTRGLLTSIPRIRKEKLKRLPTIEGMVPDLLRLPSGCAFAGRCQYVEEKCRQSVPPLENRKGRRVACFYPREDSL